jgi:probable rRNA maturation factor
MNRPAVAVLDRRIGPDPLPVDGAGLAELLGDVLAAEGVPERAEAALILIDADGIAELNAAHLGGAGPTDVLSFPVDGPGPVPGGEPWLVGDVVVCPEVAAAQAPTHAGTTADELALLVVHGGLHLCGWDHAGPDERTRMWARERELLARFGRTPARDPWSDAGGEGPAVRAPTTGGHHR